MPIAVRRPSDGDLAGLLHRVSRLDPTYSEQGATRRDELPSGFRHDRRFLRVGHGDDAFRHGQMALRGWRAHRHAGVEVTPADAPLAEGATLVVGLRLGPAHVLAPCRIVYVTDEQDRFGFAYGTLPGHPEQGEEAFHVTRTSTGEVRFEVVAFSRPASKLARIGGPVARMVQERVTNAYLQGVASFVAEGAEPSAEA